MKAYDILRTRVTQLLAARRLSQVELANWIHKTPAWASGFLGGKKGTTLSTVDAIADFFHVPVSTLFDEHQLAVWEDRVQHVGAGRAAEIKGDQRDGELTERGGVMQDDLEKSLVSSLGLCPDDHKDELVRRVFDLAMEWRSQARGRATGTNPKG